MCLLFLKTRNKLKTRISFLCMCSNVTDLGQVRRVLKFSKLHLDTLFFNPYLLLVNQYPLSINTWKKSNKLEVLAILIINSRRTNSEHYSREFANYEHKLKHKHKRKKIYSKSAQHDPFWIDFYVQIVFYVRNSHTPLTNVTRPDASDSVFGELRSDGDRIGRKSWVSRLVLIRDRCVITTVAIS